MKYCIRRYNKNYNIKFYSKNKEWIDEDHIDLLKWFPGPVAKRLASKLNQEDNENWYYAFPYRV